MIRAVKAVLLNDTSKSARVLLEDIISEQDKAKIGNVKQVMISDLPDESYRFSGATGEELHLSRVHFKAILDSLQKLNRGQGQNVQEATVPDIVCEQQDRYLDFTPRENQINDTLNNVRHFLHRALGRTTGMFSRVLNWTLKYLGYDMKNDSFSDVENTMKDPSFIREFASLHDAAKDTSADLNKTFNGDGKKQKLAGFLSKIINLFDKLPDKVVDKFPLLFCFHNVAIPWLAKIFHEGILGKFFSFMRIINPWIDEFLSATMGVFKHEIKNVKRNIGELRNKPGESVEASRSQSSSIESKEEIDTISLSGLTKEQYSLKKIVDKVNSAFERLIGRENNISALVFKGILNTYGFSNYQQFARATVSTDDFILKLHKCLIEASEDKKAGETESTLNKKIDEVFHDDPKQCQVAKVLVSIISIAKDMDEKYITSYPRKFGNVYSWQYLFMPLLTVLVGNKGFFGKLFNFIADVNPIINDFCFDPLATFQEEIKGVKAESKSISHLLPEIPKLSWVGAYDRAFSSVRSIWGTIRKFISDFKFAPVKKPA